MLQDGNVIRFTGALLWVMVVSFATSTAWAQLREGFESPDPSWTLSGADGGVRVVSQRRQFEGAHGGVGSEHFRFVAGRGSHIYFSLPVERSPLVEETNVSLWVKGDRTRFQLMVRVVLPRALDERSGKPLTTLLKGDEYLEVGSWQPLRIADLPRLLARDVIVLRKQYGPWVDAREAYIDLVVLNAYGGPGETNVWVDDLELNGVIAPDWAKDTASRGPLTENAVETSTTVRAERPLVVDGDVLLLEGRPQFLRAIEERGESWDLLRNLGFNTIWLSTAPTAAQHEEAKRLGLWLVAPPPEVREDPGSVAKQEQVIAWFLGHRLGTEDFPLLKQFAAEIRAADRALRRPVCCAPRADVWNFSRQADLLLFEGPPLFSSLEFSAATNRIRQQAAQARAGAPFWLKLRLEPSPELREQLRLFDPADTSEPTADYTQARLAMFAALRAGPRGLLFASSTPLNAPSEAAQGRQSIYRLLNQELRLLEPWLAGGTAPREITTGDPTLNATLWQTERSRLVLLARQGGQDQYAPAPVEQDSMQFTLPGATTFSSPCRSRSVASLGLSNESNLNRFVYSVSA